jgi:hypothetical protein
VSGLDCRDCDGTGREIAGYSDYNFTARDPGASAITRVCTTCKGSGRSRCAYCGEQEGEYRTKHGEFLCYWCAKEDAEDRAADARLG